MTIDEAKEEIRYRFPHHLRPARKRGTYICPLCQNGTGSTGDGISVREGYKLHCFKCGFDGDLISLYERETGCGFKQAVEELARELQIDIEEGGGAERGKRETPVKGPGGAQKGRERRDYTEYYQGAERALRGNSGALSYLYGRGLTDETIQHFHLGYDPSWKNPGGKLGDGTERLIVPLWKYGYLARALHPVERGEKIHAGEKRPFNLDAIPANAGRDGEYPPIVVEGAFDAMTLWQWGFRNPIALNGNGTTAKTLAEELQRIAPDAVYILALDNDKTGRESQQRAAEILQEAGLACISADNASVYGEAKDANEALQKELSSRVGSALASYVMMAVEQRAAADEARARERYLQTGAGMVDRFLEEITGERYKPIPTGIQAIDYATGGGFMRQTLILLGAEPGAGKTALASMIFENMARHGTKILYFNLEMSRNQLIARSLARIAYLNEGARVTAVEVLQGYRHTDKMRALVSAAATAYKEEIADGILYNPGNTGTNLDEIVSYIEEEARRQEANGKDAPLVCLDYLQLLTGGEREDDSSILKRAVSAFKNYATKHNAVVFAIMAQSRSVNKSKEAVLCAGRDTSALEYSADLQLQLLREDVEIQERVTLYVTKNRFGVADTRKGHGTEFEFLGGQSLFIPIEDERDDPLGGEIARVY